ncbi:MAG: phosphate butyryltransferase, partial [Bacteroidales bacterium]|nr:phosphate butyryltransferase [Bacteroidales bacterium]
MDIKKLDDVLTVLKTREKKRLVAAYANDDHTIEAVYNAIQEGIVEGTLVGDEATIKEV